MLRNIPNYMKLINTYYESNTFFHFNLCKRGFDSVKIGTKKIDLFSNKKLMLPIRLKEISHWVVVCADLETKELKYMDSVQGYNAEVRLRIFGYSKRIIMLSCYICKRSRNSISKLQNTTFHK